MTKMIENIKQLMWLGLRPMKEAWKVFAQGWSLKYLWFPLIFTSSPALCQFQKLFSLQLMCCQPCKSSTNPSNLATQWQSVFKFQLPFTAGKQKCQETRTCQPTPGRSPVAIPPLRWRGRLVQHAGRCGVRANGCHQPPQTWQPWRWVPGSPDFTKFIQFTWQHFLATRFPFKCEDNESLAPTT